MKNSADPENAIQTPDPPPAEAIRVGLERILTSSVFNEAPTLQRFLRYVVEKTLQGHGDEIKEYTVAVEGLERSASFDPKSDSVVRVLARQLRYKLAEYYRTEGGDDPVLIDLPKGSYVPIFTTTGSQTGGQPPEMIAQTQLAEPAPEFAMQPHAPSAEVAQEAGKGRATARGPRASRTSKGLILAACGIAILIVLASVAYLRKKARMASSPSEIAITVRRSVAVLPFTNLSGSSHEAWLSTAFAEWLTTELASGRELRAIPQDRVAQALSGLHPAEIETAPEGALVRVGKYLGADLVVFGSFAVARAGSGNRVRLDVKVVDTSDGHIRSTFSETQDETDVFDLASRAGEELREHLGIPPATTEEAGQVRAALPSSAVANQLYVQGLEKLRTYNALAARGLFQRSIAVEPDYPLVHSALSQAWLMLGYEVKAREEASKAVALSVNLSPEMRRLIEARQSEVTNDWAKAIEIYEALWTIFPDDPEYGLDLASAQVSGRRGTDALATISSLRKPPYAFSADPRIDLTEAAADESRSDFRGEVRAAEMAAERARTAGETDLEGRTLLSEGWALDNLGQLQKALQIDDHAKGVFTAVGDQAGVAKALKDVGDALEDEGDFSGSRGAYEQALTIFRAIGYQTGIMVVLNNMAFDFKSMGDMDEARRMYQQAATLSRELGDRPREALALNGLAILLWREDDLEDAARLYQEGSAV